MQVLPLLTFLATALAGQSFNALFIHSGSDYQYASFKASGSDVIAGYNDPLQLVLNSDGSLIDRTLKKYVYVGDDHRLTLSSNAQTGFSFKGRYLAYNNLEAFAVCGESKVQYNPSEGSCIGVAVRIEQPQNTDDVRPDAPETKDYTGYTSAGAVPALAMSPAANKDSKDATDKSAYPSWAGRRFGLIAIHAGSGVHNYPIRKVAEHPHVFSVGGSDGYPVILSFIRGTSSLVDQDGRGVNLDQRTGELGSVAPFGRQPATPGFSIDNDRLAYKGDSGWRACPSAVGFSLSRNDCIGGTTIELKVVND